MPPVSKIAKLPAHLRKQLHALLAEKSFGSIVEITEQLNAWLKAEGHELTVGKSAVGEESKRLKRAQEAIAATTRAAQLIAESAPDAADHRSAAAMALIQSEVFELLLQVREASDEQDPEARLAVMSEAALAMSRLSRSRVNQARWAQEVEARVEAAAKAVEKITAKGGLNAAQRAEILQQILGIAAKPAAQAAVPTTTQEA